MLVSAYGGRRLRVDHWLPDDPYPRATVEDLPAGPDGDDPGDSGAVAGAGVAVRRLRSLLSELGDVPALAHDLDLTGDDQEVGWRLCQLAPLNLMDRQRLLGCVGLGARMELLGALCAAMTDDVVALLAGGLGG